MKTRSGGVIVLAIAVLSGSFGPGCGANTANDGGENATQSIKDPNPPTTQAEYAKRQMEKDAAAKKAGRTKK